MLSKLMPISRVVMIMAVAALVIGIVFIYQGVSKANAITGQMRDEAVPASTFIEGAPEGDVIDTAVEAQKAADTIKEHRKNIATNYEALLAGGRYDPTNPKHLSYTQAMNMENYLYMGVFALGFTQAVMVIGVFMILMGLALGAIWLALRKKQTLASTS
ncbi:MAG: hypothetical protein FJ004_08190 [Chloroflexi bacterium]|nr:hypothetical protein [Chloroflexota bacterium]